MMKNARNKIFTAKKKIVHVATGLRNILLLTKKLSENTCALTRLLRALRFVRAKEKSFILKMSPFLQKGIHQETRILLNRTAHEGRSIGALDIWHVQGLPRAREDCQVW